MSPVAWGDIFTSPLRGDRIMELRHTQKSHWNAWLPCCILLPVTLRPWKPRQFAFDRVWVAWDNFWFRGADETLPIHLIRICLCQRACRAGTGTNAGEARRSYLVLSGKWHHAPNY